MLAHESDTINSRVKFYSGDFIIATVFDRNTKSIESLHKIYM